MANASLGGRKRTYNSRAMNDRRESIINATQELISENGFAGVTVRAVSKRAHVALRTLYLYFENREEMIAVAIEAIFNRSIGISGTAREVRELDDMLRRFDWLVPLVMENRNYSAALAPVYFSGNLDQRIYTVLRKIALSHVQPFADITLYGAEDPPDSPARDLFLLQVANIQYSVINDALTGRLSCDDMATHLKLSVLALMIGAQPEPSPALIEAMALVRKDLS